MRSDKKHWDSVFSTIKDEEMGWYEKNPTQTFRLLKQIPDWKNATIFLPGVGTSFLIEKLLSNSNIKLIINDISSKALGLIKKRMTKNIDQTVWLCQDISHPISIAIPKTDVWIDRAVLHFLTDENAIKGYFLNVKKNLKKGGYIILAEFAKSGASKCSGLNVYRYSLDEFTKKLGSNFVLIDHFEFTYFTPNGNPRPYIYALYKKEI